MSRRLREESGFALVPVIFLLLMMLMMGFALLSTTDSQSDVSRREHTRESSFNLAESALTAHAAQLGRSWPTTSAAPTSCDPSSTNTACPQATAVTGGYTATDYGAVCSSSPTTPAWQTTVRDNLSSNEQFWTTAVNSRNQYDANGDGVVWLRATATVRCHDVSVVALVSHSIVPIAFSNNAVTANFIQTSNQGKKVIIDTLGTYAQPPSARPGAAAQPGAVVARCSGMTQAQCLKYDASKGQIQPPAARTDTTVSTTALSSTQLASLERQASAAGTYWPNANGSCPTTAAQLASVGGAPVVVKGPCAVTLGSNNTVNSGSSPGALVIEQGTFSISGNATFYGLIYMANQQGSSGTVLNIQGNGLVQGVVSVDGLGGVTAGSSKTNLIYDPRAATLLKGETGAAIAKNSFRVLAQGTP
ncbi:MAG TPA: hypothetical protein VF526_21820 [Solirubrobacteraceae bacterium]